MCFWIYLHRAALASILSSNMTMAGAIGLLIRLTSCHKKSLLIHFPRKFLEPPLTSDAAESAGMNFNIAGIPGHHLVLMTSQVTINRLCEAPIDQKPSQVASSA